MALSKPDDLAVWIKFWNATEGRDKFTKCIQYGCRALSYLFQDRKNIHVRLSSMSQAAGDARKVFRLGKFVNEYQKLLEALASPDPDSVAVLLHFLSRAAYLGYWVFDGLLILAKVKALSAESKPIADKAFFFWFVGIIFSLLLDFHKLRLCLEEEQLLRSRLLASSQPREEAQQEVQRLRARRTALYLNLTKNCGDLVTASNGIRLPHKFIGRGINDGLIGLSGLTSALISCYQVYPVRPPTGANSLLKRDRRS